MPNRRSKKRRTTSKYRKPSRAQRQARNDAFEALRLMRTKGWSLARAAREAGDTGRDPRTILRHVGVALSKGENGRYTAKPSDRLKRYMEFLASDGNLKLEVEGSRKASLIAEYFEAVKRYLSTGETDTLGRFEGRSLQVGGNRYPFITDLETLERLGNAGVVSFEDLYALDA